MNGCIFVDGCETDDLPIGRTRPIGRCKKIINRRSGVCYKKWGYRITLTETIPANAFSNDSNNDTVDFGFDLFPFCRTS